MAVPTLENTIAFLLISLIIIVIPGPGVTFAIGRALTIGKTGAFISVLGHAVGVGIQIVAIAAGLGALIAASSLGFTLMKYIGAAILIFLGVQAFRHRKFETQIEQEFSVISTRRIISDSLLVGITNVKTAVFFLATFPQFVSPAEGSVALQILILGAMFLVVGIAMDSVWALAASFARGWLIKSGSRISAVRGAGGIAIAGLGVHTAISN